MPKRRLALLLAGFPLYAAVLMLFSMLLWCVVAIEPSSFVDAFPWVDTSEWWWLGFLPGLLIASTQYLFLVPVLNVRVGVRPEGRSLLVSLVGAAFAAALAATALVLALTDVVWLLARGDAWEYDPLWPLIIVVLAVLACSWLIWTPIFVIFCRRRPDRTGPGRLVGLLLGGTLAETVVIIPIDVLVRVRSDCYCVTASFHATWVATLALLWLTGPGIVLAVMSRRRRAWLQRCPDCGYRKGPSPGPKCPECGQAW